MWRCRTYHPPFLVFLPPLPKETNFETFASTCRIKLSEALVAIPPLAGRFVARDGGNLAVDCNDAGVQFRTAVAYSPLPRKLGSGVTLNGTEPLSFEVPGAGGDVPLLLMQVTHFHDDRLCVSFGFHPMFTDGWGAATFAGYWAHLMRGEKPPVGLEYARPTNLQASGRPLASRYHPALCTAPPFALRIEAFISFLPRGLPQVQVIHHRCFFPTAQLKGLARTESRQVTRLVILQNGRKIIPIRTGYVGNVLIPHRTGPIAVEHLCAEPLTWSARLVRAAVRRADSGFVQATVDWVTAQPDVAAVRLQADHHRGPDVCIASAPDLPLASLDLGFGQPLSLGQAHSSSASDGLVLLTAYDENGGGVCADVSLLEGLMRALLADTAFKRFTKASRTPVKRWDDGQFYRPYV
ncbi:transferase family protein [Klebsormidium nitens]|uniref:Transferase family protein n=1 Tax=Klebsormidium nitens TaxID=105231 RepID=A0A0U9HS81_KLENI|nr:transferase family protein [Klebsormidium nitens]|eukprot:GAQ86655.1 transferase family protein [Klebsormidium nitens]